MAKSKADSRWGRVSRPASATVLGAAGLDQMNRPKEPVAKVPAENTLEIIGSGLVGRCCVACGPWGDDIRCALQKTTPVQEAALPIPRLLATAGLATVEAKSGQSCMATPFFESVCTLRENRSDSLAIITFAAGTLFPTMRVELAACLSDGARYALPRKLRALTV